MTSAAHQSGTDRLAGLQYEVSPESTLVMRFEQPPSVNAARPTATHAAPSRSVGRSAASEGMAKSPGYSAWMPLRRSSPIHVSSASPLATYTEE